jgi:hypothetical protein
MRGSWCWQGGASCAAALVLSLAQAGEAPPNMRYSHASQLTLRAAPAGDAAALGRLPINQPLLLLGQQGRWCEVRPPDVEQAGFVDCAFLAPEKLDVVAIEEEAARLLRGLLDKNSPLDQAQELNRLFRQIERHFALSPSLYAYNDYEMLYETVKEHSKNLENQDLTPLFQLPAHAAKLQAMLRDLSRSSWEGDSITVRHSIVRGVVVSDRVWMGERYLDRFVISPGEPMPDEGGVSDWDFFKSAGTSFFGRGKWAVGWVGGPRIGRVHGSRPPVYRAGFNNGGNAPLLSGVYEMVKAHRLPVKVNLAATDIEQESSDPPLKKEALALETNLPIWAITASGLVQGRLRRAALGSDDSACWGSPGFAEIEFDRPIDKRIYGVFATNADFDPALAKIVVNDRTFLEGSMLGGEGSTLTYREEASVDLDGDGVADLRVLLSTDHSAHRDDAHALHVSFTKARRGGFRRVAGWYAYDTYLLLANEDGQWRLLSRYNLVTCT